MGADGDGPSGSWDSIHVFEASERGRTAHYKLTSTIMLSLVTRPSAAAASSSSSTTPNSNPHSASAASTVGGETTLSGSMTRQIETDGQLADAGAHVGNVGRAIEEMESKMRNLLQEVYFGKTRDVVFEMRSVEDLERQRKQRDLQRELVGFMKR
jgi:capping protein (actin filament) muscle Z-line, beta